MEGIFKLFLLAGLFSISLAQCTGSFSNTIQQVSVNWTVIGNNSVRFTYTAPANSSQYTALAFSNSLIASIAQIANVDAVYAGNNGTSSFVQDRWIENAFSNALDTNQNLESISTLLSGSFLTINFTRPIISPDKTQDLDLNVCRYVIYIYGGTVDSFTMPTFTVSNAPTGFGIFPNQLCLQNCQDFPDTPSPSITTTSTVISQASNSITMTSSVSLTSTTPSATLSIMPSATPSATPSSAASGAVASLLFIIIAVAIALQITIQD